MQQKIKRILINKLRASGEDKRFIRVSAKSKSISIKGKHELYDELTKLAAEKYDARKISHGNVIMEVETCQILNYDK